jgi:cell division protein FtsB
VTLPQLLGVVGALILLLIALVGFFGKRLLEQVDTALATAAQNNEALRAEVSTLTNQLKTNSDDMKKMRDELSTFRRAFHAFDKWLYGEAQHGRFKNPPPAFPPTES